MLTVAKRVKASLGPQEQQCGGAGNGGYGRLGHVKQEDSFKPKLIESFGQRAPVAPHVVSSRLCTAHQASGYTSQALYSIPGL